MIGKQVLVIGYVGEKPDFNQAAQAIVALAKSGVIVDTTVDPTVCILDEREQAQAMSVFATRKASEGHSVTIKVEDPYADKNKAKLAKAIEILKGALNV